METMKLTRAVAVALYDVINKLLFNEKGEERSLPCDVKYKIQRNRALVERDYTICVQKRQELIEGALIEKDDEKVFDISSEEGKKAQETFNAFMNEVISHEILKLEPGDMECFKEAQLSTTEVDVLIACLVDDPNLMEELTK